MKCEMDGKHNPYLVVYPDGIEVSGITSGRHVPVDLLPDILNRLPNSAWPYGLIVAVQTTGLVGGEDDVATAAGNMGKLLRLLKQIGITVDRRPSA